jgi:hypothetical protein
MVIVAQNNTRRRKMKNNRRKNGVATHLLFPTMVILKFT